MDKYLHIICLDIPYPADYGGVFDLFYKIKSLYNAGIKIHLHCFEYGRARQTELNKYCSTVQYYQRATGLAGFSMKLPYIVSSRRNAALLENLLVDDHPILAEGIHCSYLLTDERFKERRVIVRLHNVEYLYYHQLAHSTSSITKKIYYAFESRALYRYEKSIANKIAFLAVSEHDMIVYQNEFGAKDIEYLPVFLPYSEVSSREGTGCYCLYHGNLSVAENEKAVLWLLTHVFKGEESSLVIAGKNPSRRLQSAVSRTTNSCLVANPTEHQLQDLIFKAQINILPSFNKTGIKLKLLNALFNGRHCVVNEAATAGTSLDAVCHVGKTAGEIKSKIAELKHQPFGDEEITRRKRLLEGSYNNSENVLKLIRWIW